VSASSIAMARRRLRWGCGIGVIVSLVAWLGASEVRAQGSAPSAPAPSVAEHALLEAEAKQGDTVVVNHRPIVTFHAPLLGRSPRERALAGSIATKIVVQRGGPGRVTVWQGKDTAGLQVDGIIVLYLTPDDIDSGTNLAEAAEVARERLQQAVNEMHEATDVRSIGIGLALSALATVLIYALVRAAFVLRRRLLARLGSLLDNWRPMQPGKGLLAAYVPHARAATSFVALALTWGLALLLLNLWATFVLRQFAFTRYWGERASQWFLGVLQEFAAGIAEAVPGLLTVVLIFLIARQVTRANGALMRRVEYGELDLAWLDQDTAGPTRRIGNFVIWLFALAVAYPFLPGSSSDAFKGVSVLAGLMLSLGASSVVGQVMAGLALMYSRSLRVGEYVKAGNIEGTVAAIGLFAIKVHTGVGQEVSVPNTVVVSGPVENYSRLAHGQFILHTAITIGYSTPWRQVHAMLIEAARRTPGVVDQPPPYVLQAALSDFYVEYRLCAHSGEAGPQQRAEALNLLHANVQDVFNENGVQIMSPHYVADPPQPQVVAPQAWSPPLAPAASAPKARSA
jgi:small-conductance mechanosensitive channel